MIINNQHMMIIHIYIYIYIYDDDDDESARWAPPGQSATRREALYKWTCPKRGSTPKRRAPLREPSTTGRVFFVVCC